MNEDTSNKVSVIIKEKTEIKNAACVYQFVNIFNLPSLHKATLSYIERCFTIESDTDNFYQLDYTLISKILASSSLFITSEIEVFNVAQRWLNYDIQDRRKYTNYLLLKVRLNLLSKDTIRKLLNDSKFSNKDNLCIEFLREVLDCRESKLKKYSSIYHRSRYCTQKSFRLLVCGGYNFETKLKSGKVSCVELYSTKIVEVYPPMKAGRDFSDVVYVKGDLFVFGGCDINSRRVMSVEKYSLTSKTWSKVAEMYDSRIVFCVCSFMDKIFVIGGDKDRIPINSCLQFDTSNYSWNEVSRMNKVRSHAACAVFEDRIVVSGGLNSNYNSLSTVESYDVLPDKWSPMPNMNYGKRLHSLVVCKNKLFAISQKASTFEVFDNISKTFVVLDPPNLNYSCKVLSIENKVVFLVNFQNKVIFYDVDKNEWLEKRCEVTKNIQSFSCVKVPCFLRNSIC